MFWPNQVNLIYIVSILCMDLIKQLQMQLIMIPNSYEEFKLNENIVKYQIVRYHLKVME